MKENEEVGFDNLGFRRDYETTDPENLPKKPANPSEELRQNMRHLAKTSLYYLCKVVLGYDKLVPHVHMPMCSFADNVEAYRRLMLMPRTHFKTTIWTIGQTIKDIINDPNVTVLLVADTSTNAGRFMREIQLHFEMNELFRWLFSELIPKSFNRAVWSQSEMIVPRTRVSREPTVDAIGAMGGIESRHYDIIRADDLVTEKCIRSDVEMEKLIEWAGGLESLLNQPVEEHRIDWVGSRKKKGDLYEVVTKRYGDGYEVEEIGPHATQHGMLAQFWRRDIENGKPIFPEAITLNFLNRLKKFDPQRYHAQYANSPKGSGLNVFEEDDIRYWRWSADGRMIECVHDGKIFLRMSPWAGERIIMYDPARAEKKGSSQNAIIVLLKGHPLPFRIVLEAHIGHYLPDKAVKLLFDLNKKWRPSVVSVEYRGFQGAVKYWAQEKSEREGSEMPPIIQWPPEGSEKAQWAKTEHIKGLQPLTRFNLIWLHRSQEELKEQFEFYPNVRYEDGLDCLSQSLDYWPAMLSEAEMMENAQTEIDYLEKNIGVMPIFGKLSEKMAKGGRRRISGWDEKEFLNQLKAGGYMTKN